MSAGGGGPDLRFLAGCVGEPWARLRERLGKPAAERALGEVAWLVWTWPGLALRASGRAAGGPIAAWTVTYGEGRATLREAVSPLGLWPAAAPDAAASESEPPLLRREVRDPGGGPPRTLTATLRGGRFRAVTLFDEPPDWT